jgi:nucleoside-triphosphatase THEP1
MVFILTGEKNEGKSGFALKITEQLREKGLLPGGFISIGMWKPSGEKYYDLSDFTHQRSWTLADKVEFNNSLKCGNYFFDLTIIEAGNEIIRNAVRKGADLIIIDEVGKCEINGNIWHTSVQLALTSARNVMLVVARKQIKHVIEHFGIIDYLTIDTLIENPDHTIPKLIASLD